MMKNFLFSSRSKSLLLIGFVAITAGIVSAKINLGGCMKNSDVSLNILNS